jgi:site-specific recombinase XerD
MRAHTTSNRIRRHDAALAAAEPVAFTRIVPEPPPAPVKRPCPVGDLSTAPAAEIVRVTGEVFGRWNRGSLAGFKHGMRRLLEILEQHPGATWQERWDEAGLNDPARQVADLGENPRWRSRLHTAAGNAWCMRLIQPAIPVLHAAKPPRYAERFRHVARDPLLEEFWTRLDAHPVSVNSKAGARTELCYALTVFGIDLAGVTPGALVMHAEQGPGRGMAAAWPVLHDMGLIPAWAPRTLQDARIRGRRSVEDLVDRHQLRNREIRDLLVDYIRRRSAEVDYGTMENLVRSLVEYFWKIIEDQNPAQADLRLSEQQVQAWKERLLVRKDGKPRQNIEAPFLSVRAFYLDLQTWAAAEPERWAGWVAPCPIRDADLRWFNVRRRRLRERMAARTRDRQPLLAILSQHVNDRWQNMRALLSAARNARPGEQFTVAGTTWQRAAPPQGQPDVPDQPVRVINRDTGDLLRLTHEENNAFWEWAVIETLRLAGLRREELAELTHLSVRQYQRPNGEVVALLVVSPSKSDRERVIPMSAELFHVIAQIIRRHTASYGTVPVCPRYDQQERTWCEPLPYLFQRLQSGTPRALSVAGVRDIVRRAARALVPSHPEFADVRFSPHDFRRLFATDLVNNGLPIHIGAALLGHLNVETTRGYVAVFEEDVVRHYQEFLDRRRARRPESEYRNPTPEEWLDFNEHFDKRKVELGSCGRPYGTPCQHEFACVRCPMLSINPKMLPRLDELEADLIDRRQRAADEGWHGEIEGIDLTLTFLRSKRDQAQRAAATGPISLGLPAVRNR